MKLPQFPVGGGCQCGAVRFQLTAGPLGVYNCHCKDCQRTSGATHTISVIMKREDVRFTGGPTHTFDKSADSGRIVRMHGCLTCGTKVYNEPLASPHMLVMKAGTLDDMNWARPVGNIWTASRAPWAEIEPDVPNFPGQPPSRDALFEAWAKAVTEG
jgi:hypothetical protein